MTTESHRKFSWCRLCSSLVFLFAWVSASPRDRDPLLVSEGFRDFERRVELAVSANIGEMRRFDHTTTMRSGSRSLNSSQIERKIARGEID